MKTKFFNLKTSDGIIQTRYHPLLYTRGHRAHYLALHRDHYRTTKKEWIVSDPISGYRILRVDASFKGVPVSSHHLTQKQAMMCALSDLDRLVDRIGIDKFERVLDAAHDAAEREKNNG